MANRTALISVFHKDGIIDFAAKLVELGFDLVASGGTAKMLKEVGHLEVRDVAELVGGDAILGHRVVTLSREIHAGLLARDIPEDRAELERLGIPWIDLVCVDLYPLEDEIAREGSTAMSVLEKTDIGGPSLLRSAAKGRRIVICDPRDRDSVLEAITEGTDEVLAYRELLAAKAEFVCAAYALASARYTSRGDFDGMIGTRLRALKYGENAYQTPAYQYVTDDKDPLALHKFELVHGDPSGYVNTCDMDRLVTTATHVVASLVKSGYEVPRMVIGVKHGNACGAAFADSIDGLMQSMVEGEPEDIFGGFVLSTNDIDKVAAKALVRHQSSIKRVIAGVLAPRFTEEALKILTYKKSNCCCFVHPGLADLSARDLDQSPIYRRVRGGFLKQPNYDFVLDLESELIEKYGELTDQQKFDVLLAAAIGRTSTSNTIALVKNGKLIGAGVGQKSRKRAAQLAIDIARGAGHDVRGAVGYSDSFFPFHDGPALLIAAGVAVIFSSSGSKRDADTIKICQASGTVLWLYPDKFGRGFFAH